MDKQQFENLIKKRLKKFYGLNVTGLNKLHGFYDDNFLVKTKNRKYLYKIYKNTPLKVIEFQLDFAINLKNKSISSPAIIKTNNHSLISYCNKKFAVLFEFCEGKHLKEMKVTADLLKKLGGCLGKMQQTMEGQKVRGLTWRKYLWDLSQFSLIVSDYRKNITLFDKEMKGLLDPIILNWKKFAVKLKKLPKGICHNDFHGNNIIISKSKISVIDFGDAMKTWFAGDLAIAICHICLAQKNVLSSTGVFLKGYCSERTLKPIEKELLPYLISLRSASLVIEILIAKKHLEHGFYGEAFSRAVNNLKILTNQKFLKQLDYTINGNS